MKKESWREEAWEFFLVKFWDNRSKECDSVEYDKNDLEPFLSKYKKSGQGEIRIFHYGNEKINALKKRNLTMIPLSRGKWKLIKHTSPIIFVEPSEGNIFCPQNSLTEGMVVGIKDTMKQKANPGETTLLAIANYSGIIADFYGLKNQGILFTGGRQKAGVHLVVGANEIDMTKAQIEIDGGFEWTDTVVIVEMKSSFKQDGFNVNQALLPMLKWKKLLKSKKVYSLVLLAETNIEGIEYRAYDLVHNERSRSNEMRISRSKKYILRVQ